MQVTQQFPRSGQSTSFKWKDYAPFVFHRLREAFGIDNRDYLLSLTDDKCASMPIAVSHKQNHLSTVSQYRLPF